MQREWSKGPEEKGWRGCSPGWGVEWMGVCCRDAGDAAALRMALFLAIRSSFSRISWQNKRRGLALMPSHLCALLIAFSSHVSPLHQPDSPQRENRRRGKYGSVTKRYGKHCCRQACHSEGPNLIPCRSTRCLAFCLPFSWRASWAVANVFRDPQRGRWEDLYCWQTMVLLLA